MKRIQICFFSILLIGVFSCSNYLNVTPKNVISMDDLESIKQSLGGFLYNASYIYGSGGNSLPWAPFEGHNMYGFVEYTDEWDLTDFVENDLKDYEIQKIDWRNESTQSLWSTYYSPIGFMNLIIHEALTAEGEEDMRDYILGEAYTIRAYCFFKLLQYFAPYKNNELGIPVCLETYEDFENVTLERKTQKEVYGQILSDLQEAEKRLERTNPRETYNLMYDASIVNRLYAEVYHFKALSAAAEEDDWDNAIKYADRETNGKVLESDSLVLAQVFNSKLTTVDYNPEIALRLRYYSTYSFGYLYGSLTPDEDFYLTYFPEEAGDIRRDWYRSVRVYDSNIGGYVYKLKINKYSVYTSSGSSYYLFCGFRLAEAFLIQAEAYAMTDQLTEAQEILKRFKEARYKNPFTIPTTKDDLLKDIYRERKKEFVSEGDYGWLDMKRLGQKAERTVGGVTYTINGVDDYRYAFPIPNYEIEHNKWLKQNPGWILND